MANTITLARVIIALFSLFFIQISPLYNLISVLFIVIAMVLDALDGYIARYLHTTTQQGSIYDILADRIIENVFFIYFANQGLFSVWFALIMLIRGLTIDAIRSLQLCSGKTAFGPNTFHRARWSQLLTGSRWSRGIYNTLKLLMFITYAQLMVPQGYLFYCVPLPYVALTATVLLWCCLIMALLRTVPVLYEGLVSAIPAFGEK